MSFLKGSPLSVNMKLSLKPFLSMMQLQRIRYNLVILTPTITLQTRCMNVNASIHCLFKDVGAMETDELPLSQSPIISQYGAQLHRYSTQTPNDHTPVHTPAVHTQDVHTSPVHNQETDQVGSMETDDTEMNTTNPNSPAWLEVTPKRYNFSNPNTNSAIYDKSEHPNSPPFNHVLLHGVRIYDPLSPDPPSPGPKYDSSLPPSSPLRNPLLLSPEPVTPLTSPNKSNDSLSGFAVHASTVNAFQATASSHSPPCIGTQLAVYKVLSTPHLTNIYSFPKHLSFVFLISGTRISIFS